MKQFFLMLEKSGRIAQMEALLELLEVKLKIKSKSDLK
tara:strand:+ start:2130 stop:2243 length:114 start_codon:yes stop_codon:yes gene_type:complete